MKKILSWLIVIVVIIMIVLVGGVYLFQRNQVGELSVSSPESLDIAGLSFALPEDWNLKEIVTEQNKISKWEVAKIEVPDPKYDVILPMKAFIIDRAIDDSDVFLRETSSGGKIYENFCAPAVACYHLVYKNNTYEIVFGTVESNEPVPENIDGVWFPNTIITSEDTLNLLSTLK
ncbi:hypothetical protein A2318_01560 [Candidatus Uhrbacteria bacterium RIFOXYB2_FULL_45_11]|uniref:Uncharacterized protein n=1 Tax=Candidatus Uhrbacteria bacterium RIFOXYB2_FULL_45_11 TaxID=1802421 RepID=A0A1F7W9Z1_9BACT|nr:MAG: hypothetical protein A2318_01560 [Candidatus Uhrbacteria bacterium RIFOXYB2_FULL_45_11]